MKKPRSYPSQHRRRWVPLDDQLLIVNCRAKTYSELAGMTERASGAVKERFRTLGIRKRRTQTQEVTK